MIEPGAVLPVSQADRLELTRLEESMWRAETRFDMHFMEQRFARDFFEFGRSGRTYTRVQAMTIPRRPIDATLPLPELSIRLLDKDTAQLVYFSAVTRESVVEHSRRSSIWSRTPDGWVMRFHQGTPYQTEAG